MPQEKIYTSESDQSITTSQLINETICRNRAKFLGIRFTKEYHRHKVLGKYFRTQLKFIKDAIEAYGERNVLQVISNSDNAWACDPQYPFPSPLNATKIKLQLAQLRDKTVENPTELPSSHIPEKPKIRRKF